MVMSKSKSVKFYVAYLLTLQAKGWQREILDSCSSML